MTNRVLYSLRPRLTSSVVLRVNRGHEKRIVHSPEGTTVMIKSKRLLHLHWHCLSAKTAFSQAALVVCDSSVITIKRTAQRTWIWWLLHSSLQTFIKYTVGQKNVSFFSWLIFCHFWTNWNKNEYSTEKSQNLQHRLDSLYTTR